MSGSLLRCLGSLLTIARLLRCLALRDMLLKHQNDIRAKRTPVFLGEAL